MLFELSHVDQRENLKRGILVLALQLVKYPFYHYFENGQPGRIRTCVTSLPRRVDNYYPTD